MPLTHELPLNLKTRRSFARQIGIGVFAMTSSGIFAHPEVSANDTGVSINPFLGRWRYRSFRNIPDPVTKLDELLFWEAELIITERSPRQVVGDIGDGQDKLTLRGFATFGFPNFIHFEAS